MSTPSIDAWPIKAFVRIVCALYIIYVICIIFMVIKHTLISWLWDDGDPVALLSEIEGPLNCRGQLMVIGKVSQRIHPEVHCRMIWSPQGPYPPAFPYFVEAWIAAVFFWFIARMVISARVCSSPLKCSDTGAHTILKKALISRNVNRRCTHYLTLYIQGNILKFSYWDISLALKWSGPK